jgi:hypothetical protein
MKIDYLDIDVQIVPNQLSIATPTLMIPVIAKTGT